MKIKKGFTLVELIVVITVISILSTIGFISYQGYSKYARDGKRKLDVTNLTKQLELMKTKGVDIFSFIENDISTIQDHIQISGYSGSVELAGKYLAGDPDFVNIDLNGDIFSDPLTGDPYKIGVTSFGNRYEVAAGMEQEGLDITDEEDTYSIYTSGTWLPRTSLESRAAVDKIIGKTFYMSGSTKNNISLEVNDVVRVGSGSINTYVIEKIYLDRIIVDKNISPTGDNIFLNNDETRHLIKKWDTDYAIEENKGNTHTPYDMK